MKNFTIMIIILQKTVLSNNVFPKFTLISKFFNLYYFSIIAIVKITVNIKLFVEIKIQ